MSKLDIIKNNLKSIRWKLLLICMLLVTIPGLLSGWLAYDIFKRETFRKVEESMQVIAKDWRDITNLYIQQNRRILKREEFLVEKKLHSLVNFGRDLIFHEEKKHGRSEIIAYFSSLANQFKIGYGGRFLLLSPQGEILASERSGWKKTLIFDYLPADEKDSLKILMSKNLHNSDGDSVTMHFRILEDGDRSLPAVGAFLYLPKWNLVLCAYSLYSDYKSYELKSNLQDELKYKIAQQSIGENGYIFVIDSLGNYIVSKGRMRDGENVLDSKDATGRFFVKEIIIQARSLDNYETFTMSYPWQNFGEKATREKIVVGSYVKDWDWIIGVSTYYEDVYKGLDDIKRSIVAIIIASIIIGSVVAYFFALLISKPILTLKKVAETASSGDLDVKISESIIQRDDELGDLGRSFAFMITELKNKIQELFAINSNLLKEIEKREKAETELKDLGQQLVSLSREAGMFEVASGVLHNVGNVLNSINTSTQVLKNKVDALENDSLIKLLKLLEERNPEFFKNDEKGRLVPTYVNKLQEDFERRRQELFHEINDLKKSVDHVTNVIHMQQAYCKVKSFIEPLHVAEVVEMAIAMNADSISKYNITIEQNGEDIQFLTDKHKLLQVLVNLIRNAIHAIQSQNPIERKIRFHWKVETEGYLYLEVSDTGVGIHSDHISKIFTHGFTTKKEGNGLGLHMSLLGMKELGGDMRVFSDGPGSGSTFAILLPPGKP